MDLYYDCPNSTPPSHYETVVLKEDTNTLIQHVKYISFNYMNQLEGWCTKNKASILIDLVFMLNPKTIVEIGVFGGKSLIPMAYALQVTKSGKIYGIDPWDSAASAEGMDSINYDWWSTLDHGYILKGLQEKIIQFNLTEQIILIRTTSEDAPLIPQIDILHIDGNHSEKTAVLDATKWVPLVRKGGLIIFDDITWATSAGSNESAVKWMDRNCIRVATFQEDNEWGIWVKP